MKPTALLLSLAFCLPAFAQEALKPGEVQLKMPGGGSYIGTVKDGVPDGKGYFRDPDGMQYEGEVSMGVREGVAEGLFPNGDRYKGQWRDGKPDGWGTMTFMLGGAYEGNWRAGVPDGRGTMTFAGNGRRADVTFANGMRVGAAPRVQPQPGEKTSFAILSGANRTGSLMKDKEVTSSVPLNVGYEGLTPAQKQFVRDAYPALDDGDEPPYPLKGPQELFLGLLKLTSRYQLNGDVTIYVLVGADGKALSAATSGIDDPEAKHMAGIGAALLKYKPARCGGQPCQMMVPFKVNLATIVR